MTAVSKVPSPLPSSTETRLDPALAVTKSNGITFDVVSAYTIETADNEPSRTIEKNTNNVILFIFKNCTIENYLNGCIIMAKIDVASAEIVFGSFFCKKSLSSKYM